MVVRNRTVEGNADYLAVIKDTELSLQIGRGVINPKVGVWSRVGSGRVG